MNCLILFAVSFAAATLLPLSSEGTFYYFLAEGGNVWLLTAAAGIGNTLGSAFNYWLGLKGAEYLIERGKISPKRLERSRELFGRWGGWSLWLSWVPVIGDPITFAAGVLRYSFGRFIAIVALAKFGRYLFVVLILP